MTSPPLSCLYSTKTTGHGLKTILFLRRESMWRAPLTSRGGCFREEDRIIGSYIISMHWNIFNKNVVSFKDSFYIYLFYSIRMFCLHTCMCTACLPVTHAVNRRVSGLLELKVSMVLNHHVGARNRTCVFWKSSKRTKLLSHLSIPLLCSFETRSPCIAKAQPYKCRDYTSELPQPVWTLWFKGFREIWVKPPRKFMRDNLLGLLDSCFSDDRIVNWHRTRQERYIKITSVHLNFLLISWKKEG